MIELQFSNVQLMCFAFLLWWWFLWEKRITEAVRSNRKTVKNQLNRTVKICLYYFYNTKTKIYDTKKEKVKKSASHNLNIAKDEISCWSCDT
jgi:archaellum component FlaF (FlaF/FlaG flagellin family)